MNNDTQKYFNLHKGDVQIGDTVAHLDHKLTHTLDDIVNGIGFCSIPNGELNQWPIRELADPNKIKKSVLRDKIKTAWEINRLN